MADQENRGRLNEAVEAFESFRRRRDGGDAVDFDALCAAHPELEEDLRFLDSVYAQGRTAASTVSLRDLLQDRLGDDGVARFCLDESPHEKTSDDVRGEKDARYLYGEEIGRGGMSRIVSVWDREFRRTLAMKVSLEADGGFSPPGIPSPRRASVERLLEEALVTSQLDHPGIVPVYDVGLDAKGHGYFTMRLVKGKSLRDVIDLARRQEGGWSRSRCLEVLASVCETMAFAHARGVIHRDLKPGNIMVSSFGEPYVIDWGLAKILGKEDRHAMRLRFDSPTTLVTVETRRTGRPSDDPEDSLATPAGTVVGTPVYMPPEQAEGRVEAVNQASDVYALGAILYTLLAGRPPYVPPDGKASPLSILGKVIEGPPAPIRDIDPAAPRALVRICEKSMARRQTDRHPDALTLARDLRECIQKRSQRLPPIRDVKTTRTSGDRVRTWTGAIVLIGLAAVLLPTLLPRDARDVDEVTLLAELQRLDALEREIEPLWPAMSRHVDAVTDWLARSSEWSEPAADYRRRLGELRTRPDGDAVLGGVLGELVGRLDALLGNDATEGKVSRVERDLEFSRLVRRRTIDDMWPRWQEAVTSIADRERCPDYDGLALPPQEGLVPIGRDPVSGRWEFAHLRTGSIPRRGADGTLERRPENGLVFVLVPGAANIAPFFISKYRMTWAQWVRMTEVSSESLSPRPLDPVADVSWATAERELRRLGFELPTIAQWDLVAGEGVTTPVEPPFKARSDGIVDTDRIGVRPIKTIARTQEDLR